MRDIDDVVRDANHWMHEEVERQVKDWVQRAKGVKFTRLLEDTAKEREQLRARVRELESTVTRLKGALEQILRTGTTTDGNSVEASLAYATLAELEREDGAG